jgi:hypothetical protein
MNAVEAARLESETDRTDADGKLAWESPEAIEIDLGAAQTANTNSNFDGTNFSS